MGGDIQVALNQLRAERYISAQWFHLIISSLNNVDLDTHQLISHSGISTSALNNPEALFSEDDLTRLWQAATFLSGNPAIGLTMAINPNFGMISPDLLNLLSSDNVGEAQRRMIHVLYAIGTSPHLKLDQYESGNKIVIYREAGKLPPNHQSFDAVLAMIAFGTRFATHVDISPSYVSVEHQKPSDITPYQKLFKCPIHFNQKEYAIFYDREALATPLIFSNKELAYHQDHDNGNNNDSFTKQVQTYLKSEISGGEPQVQDVADHFRLGARTLQRRLKKEGWTYNTLLDKTRKELAILLINQPSLSLKQVAHELGFSDHSSFYRAFKRWYDSTPGDYRKSKKS